jgi:hypothetical protein
MANAIKHWYTSLYPPLPPQPSNAPPQLPNYNTNFLFKFLLGLCYYIDGSFQPPKYSVTDTWSKERVGYGIFNPIKKHPNC